MINYFFYEIIHSRHQNLLMDRILQSIVDALNVTGLGITDIAYQIILYNNTGHYVRMENWAPFRKHSDKDAYIKYVKNHFWVNHRAHVLIHFP
jgi:hypothetical protein